MIIVLAYLIGLAVSALVYRHRAGISLNGRLSLEFVLRNLPWFLYVTINGMLWPLTLILWLRQGKPASCWELTEGNNGTMLIKRVKTNEETS
jgi:hypothetical protein